VPPDIRDGPELPKELGVITVDGERSTVEPFDPPIATWDHREPLRVGLNAEPVRLGKRTELLGRALLLG